MNDALLEDLELMIKAMVLVFPGLRPVVPEPAKAQGAARLIRSE
jgi:hypothetical protein